MYVYGVPSVWTKIDLGEVPTTSTLENRPEGSLPRRHDLRFVRQQVVTLRQALRDLQGFASSHEDGELVDDPGADELRAHGALALLRGHARLRERGPHRPRLRHRALEQRPDRAERDVRRREVIVTRAALELLAVVRDDLPGRDPERHERHERERERVLLPELQSPTAASP